MTDPTRHSLIEDIQGIAFGVCVGAVGLQIMTHMGFVSGQTVGLAALASYATGLSFPIVYVAISLPFLWLGYRRMGARFAVKTAISVGLLALATASLPRWIEFGQISPAFAAMLFGTLFGFSALSVVRHGGSFGGLSIVGLLIQDKTGFPAGYVQIAFDMVIFAAASIMISPMLLLYSFLGALVFNLFLAVNHRRDRYVAI
ncbi:MAG: YitT family protein [Cereibacter sphaeroides]|uniref:YitT family protein n=1 Tax=Cereibacter sphaeroides TaxID=1063 RepID=A0A2W5U7W5_CERSP|nr:MAG: YitT family protein [Cereibacter sphaeroides]